MFKKEFGLLLAGICAVCTGTTVHAQLKQDWRPKPGTIATRWAKQVSPSKALPEYPRPQLVRKHWINLNGLWDYAITDKTATAAENFSGKILVPYPIESSLSGVKKRLSPEQFLWYKRTITKPVLKTGERVMLRFGAVDFEANVYINGNSVGSHSGGFQNFSFDITDQLKEGSNELTVRVWDPTDQGPNPHGKQVLDPGGIMYTPSSGIWQTVWLEIVPAVSIDNIRLVPDIDGHTISIAADLSGEESGITIKATIQENGKVIAGKTFTGATTVAIPSPKLWSPDNPFLYDLQLQLIKNGKVLDQVSSYFGMRKIEIRKDRKGTDRIFLNNQYTYNLGTLDQGFWPDGLYTAPTDEALAFDIKAAKAMGFNTIRKHIKVEPARWYYHADRLGMLVWQDMVNPGSHTTEARAQFEKENKENIAQLYNHPSIVVWVLFNEKWGQYDQERLTKELKQLDPTRLINGHSGEILYVNDVLRSPSPDAWVGADMTDVHAYPMPGHVQQQPGKAAVIGEFGGIGVPVEGHLWDDLVAGWGYDGVVTTPVMKKQYTQMVDSLKVLEQAGLSASIYTQPFDVESEQNGLITYDREIVKLPVTVMRNIHARLWPATQNHLLATKGFSATVADTINKDYAARLKDFASGKKDSAFLRGLAAMALQYKDSANLTKITTAYLQRIKDPLLENNLNFLVKVTTKLTDPGFAILQKSVALTGYDDSPLIIKAKLEEIIYNTEVKKILNENPDWNKIEAIIRKYPPLEGERIRGLCVVKYLNAAAADQKNGTRNVVEAATRYDDRYHSGAYNAWAWLLFGKTNDKKELEKASEWSQKAIGQETEPGRKAAAMDTHANLLYKLGRKEEALQWQEKAVALSGDLEIKTNFEKMKRGEPTWPNLN